MLFVRDEAWISAVRGEASSNTAWQVAQAGECPARSGPPHAHRHALCCASGRRGNLLTIFSLQGDAQGVEDGVSGAERDLGATVSAAARRDRR